MIAIRFAIQKDAAFIAELSRQTFYETFAPFNTVENMEKFMRESFSTQLLMDEVGAPGNIFLLAEEGATTVGYARLRLDNIPPSLGYTPALEISRIYVVSEFKGTGVGNALMQKAIDIAIEHHKPVIWLGVWEQNERAIAFYHHWGFEKFDTHIFQLGEDAQTDWLMKKIVSVKSL